MHLAVEEQDGVDIRRDVVSADEAGQERYLLGPHQFFKDVCSPRLVLS
jgi:hypothetical protein